MSLYVPSEPSRFLSALGQMIHGQCPPRIDLFWVTGLAETLDLIEAENEATPGTHDLWPEDIERVSVAWGDFESASWNGGFVVQLYDGRNKYIESRTDVVARLRHFFTVFGFRQCRAARERVLSCDAWSSARIRGIVRAQP